MNEQEALLKDISTRFVAAEDLMEELGEEWEHESDGCPHHDDGVGDCAHKDSESSSMTSCNPQDCPLRLK